jgi:hypothetical protein
MMAMRIGIMIVVARSIPLTPRATIHVAPRIAMMCGSTGASEVEKSRQ